jgi:hypothetical protein
MSNESPVGRVALVAVGLVALIVPTTSAQSTVRRPVSCEPLCTPTIALMPALLHSHVGGGPRVMTMADGTVGRLPSASNLELVVVASARTVIPRTSVVGSVQWLPNATEARNPFTEYSASTLGGHVHADAPTVTIGASVAVLSAPRTKGLLDLALFGGDLFSPATRPDDRRAYTHKLDAELTTSVHAFGWAPEHSYLHRLRLVGVLDYVATGLPHAGDEVPVGRRFLDDARPLSFIAGLSIPITTETP